jgi:hypothetical protein
VDKLIYWKLPLNKPQKLVQLFSQNSWKNCLPLDKTEVSISIIKARVMYQNHKIYCMPLNQPLNIKIDGCFVREGLEILWALPTYVQIKTTF